MASRFTAQTDRVDAIADAADRDPVRAAGGLLVRDGRILLVHRPRFDDWSLPKGKLKRGEHPLAAAVREVQEETTLLGQPGVRLPSVTYQVWSGQSLVDKVVDWWAMTSTDGVADGVSRPAAFTPTDEVDDLAWMPARQALEVLTYDRDRWVVSAYAELPPLSRPVVVLGHASAGVGQATAISGLLRLIGPDRLVSAPPLRCQQTLAELARGLAIEVEVDERFDEGGDPAAAAVALRSLATDTAAVVCSHGEMIPAAIARLTGRSESEYVVAPGEALVLSFSGDRLVAADRLTPDGY